MKKLAFILTLLLIPSICFGYTTKSGTMTGNETWENGTWFIDSVFATDTYILTIGENAHVKIDQAVSIQVNGINGNVIFAGSAGNMATVSMCKDLTYGENTAEDEGCVDGGYERHNGISYASQGAIRSVNYMVCRGSGYSVSGADACLDFYSIPTETNVSVTNSRFELCPGDASADRCLGIGVIGDTTNVDVVVENNTFITGTGTAGTNSEILYVSFFTNTGSGGSCLVRNNLIYSKVTLNEIAMTFDISGQNTGSGGTFLCDAHNNTISSLNYGTSTPNVNFYYSNAYNNIISGAENISFAGATHDYNICWDLGDGNNDCNEANESHADPLFASHVDDNYETDLEAFHLGTGSPAIDSGSANAIDITLVTGTMEDAHALDTGANDTGVVDMGFHFSFGDGAAAQRRVMVTKYFPYDIHIKD